jgi:hypothetical protein
MVSCGIPYGSGLRVQDFRPRLSISYNPVCCPAVAISRGVLPNISLRSTSPPLSISSLAVSPCPHLGFARGVLSVNGRAADSLIGELVPRICRKSGREQRGFVQHCTIVYCIALHCFVFLRVKCVVYCRFRSPAGKVQWALLCVLALCLYVRPPLQQFGHDGALPVGSSPV